MRKTYPVPVRKRESQRIAQEAAKLMHENGIRDFRHAKIKAAQRLGIRDAAALPRNAEIEAALRQHLDLFATQPRAAFLRIKREHALHAMRFFARFSPRLAGPMLEGTATAHDPIILHLHTDEAEEFARFLQAHEIHALSRFREVHFNAKLTKGMDYPLWRIHIDGDDYELLILPLNGLRHAPLSSITGKPMMRASEKQLEKLLTEANANDGNESDPL